MKWIAIVVVLLGLIAVAAAVAAFIGSRLPRGHSASGERLVHAAPETLWRTLTEVDAFPSWRPDVKRVQRLPDRNGKMTWVEEGRTGKITFVFDRLDPPRMIVSRIADSALPFGGTWTLTITPAAGGAMLQIREDGEIYNPLFRFMARFFFGYDRTVTGYLRALEKKFNGV